MQFLKFGGGRNFYLKDFRNAYHFRPDVAPPRQKFEGYINFVPNRALLGTFLEDNKNLRTRLSSLVRTAQLPELQVQTQVVNAFNQKRNEAVDDLRALCHETFGNGANVYIFGSCINGFGTKSSDVDCFVMSNYDITRKNTYFNPLRNCLKRNDSPFKRIIL